MFMTDLSTLAADLIDVQSQLSFQEDTIASLNDALTQQQKEILTLRRQVELLKHRQDEQSTSSNQDNAPSIDEKPPHY